MKQKKRDRIYIRTGIVFLTLSGLLMGAARFAEGFAEWYAEYIYVVFLSVFGRVFGLFPFSVSEILLYLSALCTVMWIGKCIYAAASSKPADWKRVLASFRFVSIFCIASMLLFSYTAGCGINYYRESFAEKENFIIESYSLGELAEVCLILTEELNGKAESVKRDENGVMIHEKNLQQNSVQAMKKLAEEFTAVNGWFPEPKKVLLPWILSVQKITGIYSPFTFEANYNGDIPDYSVPFSACHELAHLKGYMQEEEANFIAWLACRRAEGADFQYSGSLRGWISCMNALYRMDPDLWKEIRVQLNPAVEADLLANRQYWARYEGPVADAAQKVNDTYLKANGQSEGIRSYGRMADLIVAYYLR